MFYVKQNSISAKFPNAIIKKMSVDSNLIKNLFMIL